MDYRELRNKKLENLFPSVLGNHKGSGLINGLINSLPVECHLPGGYQYCGPGTYLDQKLAENVKPKNKLDEAAMNHDIAYSKSNNLEDRHAADYKLQEDAWKCVTSNDTGLAEKANAWLVTNCMKIKRKLGAGVKEPKYVKCPVNLDKEQQQLIASASKPITIKLGPRTKDSIMSDLSLPLTEYQRRKVKKGEKIKLSVAQLKHIRTGDFLPSISLPAISSLVSSAINAYNGEGIYLNKRPAAGWGIKGATKPKKHQSKQSKKSKGKGIYINKKPAEGYGLKKRNTAIGLGIQGNQLYNEFVKSKKNSN